MSPPPLHQTKITRSKYRSLNQTIWENIITHLDEETDPKKIWTSINKLQGNTSKPKATYLRDKVQKIFNNSGKDQIFRQYWVKVFSISPDVNDQYDKQNDKIVQNSIEPNKHYHIPKDNSNIIQLTDQQFRTFSSYEIKRTLISMKKKAPGKSQIRKTQLTNLANNMVQ